MARLLAVANQKGGVAKTTTVHSLGYALAELGRRVLLVDLDPQACLTYSTGVDPDSLDSSLHDVIVRRLSTVEVRRSVHGAVKLDILPATLDLGASEIHLLTRPGRDHVLARALSSVQDEYDFVIIDCPPSLGLLTINGLTAAEELLIPFQCETLSSRGVRQLLELVEDIRVFTNSKLTVRGLIPTMYDHHTKHRREILAHARTHFGLPVLDPPVRRSIKFAESPGERRCIMEHAPWSAGAQAYRALARQLDAPGLAGDATLAEGAWKPPAADRLIMAG